MSVHLAREPASGGAHLGRLVGHEGALSGVLALSPSLELSKVPVVVALHLEVEHLRGGASSEGTQKEKTVKFARQSAEEVGLLARL